MKKIVQLNQEEYNKLLHLAELNEKQIESKALALYQEKGVHAIELRIEPSNYNNKFQIKPSAYFQDWDSFFPTEYGDKKKFLEKLEGVTFDILEKKFGAWAYRVNEVIQAKKEANNLKNTLTVFTLIGWATAVTMFVIIILGKL